MPSRDDPASGAPAAPDARRPRGALEGEVMAALWAGAAPMTAGQVQEALGGRGERLAYKTVLTVLGRLYAKGLLERESAGRAHAYRPRKDPAEAVADRMRAALSRTGDRTAVLRHFVDTLSPEDEAALRALLDARK